MTKLKLSFTSLLATVALSALVAAPAFAKVSPAVGNALKKAQNLARSNASAANAQIQIARSAASTAEEKRNVSQMAAYVYNSSGQYTKAAEELKNLGSPSLNIAKAYYAGGSYANAAEFANKSGGEEASKIAAQSYMKLGETSKALAGYKKLVAANPKSEYLANLASLEYKVGDKTGYQQTLEKLIRQDPSPTNWKLLLGNLKLQPMADPAKLGLFMLLAETKNINDSPDYQEFAKLAIVTGAPALAKSVLEASGKTAEPPIQSLIKSAETRLATSATAVSKLSTSTAASDNMKAGRTLFSNGNFPAAIAQFEKALKDTKAASEGNLWLGLAQLRAGNSAAAAAAFKAIPGGSTYADVGGLWKLYTSTKH